MHGVSCAVWLVVDLGEEVKIQDPRGRPEILVEMIDCGCNFRLGLQGYIQLLLAEKSGAKSHVLITTTTFDG